MPHGPASWLWSLALQVEHRVWLRAQGHRGVNIPPVLRQGSRALWVAGCSEL